MLIGVMTDPNYAACITRESKVQLKGSGSIFPTATKVFESAAKASTNRLELAWTFPEGQEIKALHLKDNQNDYQGQQNTAYYCDEAVQCREEDVIYLLSRLRSKAKMAHQLILATNPLYDSLSGCGWRRVAILIKMASVSRKWTLCLYIWLELMVAGR